MSWEERAERGRDLAGRNELVSGELLSLLLDPEDTAVTFSTAVALLARDDDAGLELVLRAAARGDDQTVQWLYDAVLDHAAERLTGSIHDRVAAYASDPDPELAEGAVRLRS